MAKLRWVEMRAGDEKWQSIKEGSKEIAIIVPGFPPIGNEKYAHLFTVSPHLQDFIARLVEQYAKVKPNWYADAVALLSAAKGETES